MDEASLIIARADGVGFLTFLLLGGVAGWLAGQITRRRGFGLLRNLLIGILGSVLGGILFDVIGLQAYGFLGQLVMATVGAVALLYLLHYLVRTR